MAVLVSTRGRAKLIQRLEGHQSPTDLLSELQRGQNVHSAQLAAEQASIQEQVRPPPPPTPPSSMPPSILTSW